MDSKIQKVMNTMVKNSIEITNSYEIINKNNKYMIPTKFKINNKSDIYSLTTAPLLVLNHSNSNMVIDINGNEYKENNNLYNVEKLHEWNEGYN
jgi:hypothetical protein